MKRILLLSLLATSFYQTGFGQSPTESKPTVFALVKKSNVSGLQKTLDSLNLALRKSADSLAKRPTLAQANQLYKPNSYQPDTNSVIGLKAKFGKQNDAINSLQSATNLSVQGLTNAINERIRQIDADGRYLRSTYSPPVATSTSVGLVKGSENVQIDSDGTIRVTAPGSVTLADVNPNPGRVGASNVVPIPTFDTKGRATKVESATITAAGIGANAVLSMAQARQLTVTNAPAVISITDAGKTGLFYLRSGSDPDDGAITLRAGSLVYKREFERVLPEWFGAKGDSLTDDTDAIRQAALAAPGKSVYFTQKYRVRTDQVLLPPGTTLEFAAGASASTRDSTGGLFRAAYVRNIEIRGGLFYGPSGRGKVLSAAYTSNIRLANLNASVIGLVLFDHVDQATFTAPIANNRVVTNFHESACVDLVFSTNITINDPGITGYAHGVQFWFGDANPVVGKDANGNDIRQAVPLSVERQLANITVNGGLIQDCLGGAFWGSMGRTIRGNKVSLKRAGDVGFDMEGVVDAKCIDCEAQDSKNGNYSVFFNSDEIELTNCKSIVTKPGVLAVGLHSTRFMGKLTIRNMTVQATVPTIVGDAFEGGVGTLLIEGGTFQNTSFKFDDRIDSSATFKNLTMKTTVAGVGHPIVTGNFARPGTLFIEFVKAKNLYNIERNQVGGFGMQIYHTNVASKEYIRNNEFDGYDLDVVLQPQSTSTPSQVASVELKENIFSNGQIYAPSGPLPLKLDYANFNNRKRDGSILGNGFITRTPAVLDLNGLGAGDVLRIAPDGRMVPDKMTDFVRTSAGKGLSTNDYTTVEKTKLAAVSGTNTGDQTLTLSGQKLILSGVNSSTVTLPSGGSGTTADFSGRVLFITLANSIGAEDGNRNQVNGVRDSTTATYSKTALEDVKAALPGAQITRYNFSVSGKQTSAILNDINNVLSLYQPAYFDRQIVFFHEVTNHVADGGATLEQATTAFNAVCDALTAKGFTLGVGTVTPRNSFVGNVAAAKAIIDQFNVNLSANFIKKADFLYDMNAEPGIVQSDGTHYTQASYVLFGHGLAKKLIPIIRTGFNPQVIAFLRNGTVATTPPSSTTTSPGSGTTSAGTVLLIAGNGSSITDATGKTVNLVGNPVISSAQSQYGGSSIYLDGNSFLTIPTSADFDFGTGDFTIELFARPTEIVRQYGGLISRGDETDNQWTFSYNGSGSTPDLFIRNNGSYDVITGSNSGLTLNTWQHVALVSKSGVRKVYINGNAVATSSNGRSMETMATSKRINIGAFPTPNTAGSPEQEKFKGYIQGIRVTKGTARYDGNFTPPASY
jgi:hypothetical protein